MSKTDEIIARTAPSHLIDHNLVVCDIYNLCYGMLRY
jgi:6-oxo-cyclohex-1-ene-carbonyl-CoA hydrolase